MTVLINAQWQASGCGHRYPIGAERIRNMLPPDNVTVPDISYCAGPGDVTQGLRNLEEIRASLDVACPRRVVQVNC